MPVTINPGTSGVGTPGSVSGISDGDKGDVVVSGGGAVFTLDPTTAAAMKARANHTGTQTASTISDFAEALDDRVAALIVAGTNMTKTYDDVANTLTLSSTGGGAGSLEATINYLNSDVTPITYGAGGEIATYTMNGRTWTIAYNGNGTINTETSGSFVKTYVYGDVANPTKPTSITGNGVNIDSPTYGMLLPPDAFGVTVWNSTTDISASLQLWIDYLEGLAGTVGTKVFATFPIAKTFALSTGITVDCSKVNIDFNGARCYSLAALTGIAITLTTTNGDEQAKGTQIMGGIQNLWIRGTGKTVGTGVKLVNAGIGAAHVSLDKVIVGNFAIALDLTSTNNYLNRFRECNFSGSGIGVLHDNSSNSGEAMLFFGGVLGGNDLALSINEDGGDYYFYGTSFDFNIKVAEINSSNIEMHGVHIETNGPTVRQITVQGANGHFKRLGGRWYIGGSGHYTGLDYFVECIGTAPTYHDFCVDYFNTRTSTRRFATGQAWTSRPTSHNSTTNWRIFSEETCLINCTNLDNHLAVPAQFKLQGSTSNRLAASTSTLAFSTVVTPPTAGTRTILFTRGAAGPGFDFLIPCKPGDAVMWEFKHSKETGSTAAWFTTGSWVDGYWAADGSFVYTRQTDQTPSNGITTTAGSWSQSGTVSSEFLSFGRRCPGGHSFYRLRTNVGSIATNDTINMADLLVDVV